MSNANEAVLDTSVWHPAMDRRQHEKTYAGFITASIWTTAFSVGILAAMAYFLV